MTLQYICIRIGVIHPSDDLQIETLVFAATLKSLWFTQVLVEAPGCRTVYQSGAVPKSRRRGAEGNTVALFRLNLYGDQAIGVALFFELRHQSMGRKSMLVQTIIGDWHALRSTLLGAPGSRAVYATGEVCI